MKSKKIILILFFGSDEDPRLWMESFAIINLRGVSQNQNCILKNVNNVYFFESNIKYCMPIKLLLLLNPSCPCIFGLSTAANL